MVAAAERVFARQGVRGASLEDIAAEAGVSRGAVYYNFTDKEQLFLSLLRERCEERAEQLRRLAAADGDQIGTNVRLAAEAFIDDAERDGGWTRLFIEFTSLAAERPEIRAAFATELRDCREAVAGLIRRRLNDLDLATEPLIDLATTGTIALANGLAIERLGDPALPRDLLAQLIELIIAGLQATNDSRE